MAAEDQLRCWDPAFPWLGVMHQVGLCLTGPLVFSHKMELAMSKSQDLDKLTF